MMRDSARYRRLPVDMQSADQDGAALWHCLRKAACCHQTALNSTARSKCNAIVSNLVHFSVELLMLTESDSAISDRKGVCARSLYLHVACTHSILWQ